jgi:hypothetical protein
MLVSSPVSHSRGKLGTAVAIIALLNLKYGTGVPFKRLERLQEHLGMLLLATTQWDLMAAAAKLLWPVLQELILQAAQGSVMHNDDTGMPILRLAREPGDKRTGTFTSGIVSMMGAWTIALFFTGWKHAGKNLAEVLNGAAVGDLFMSLIHTCELNDANPFDYLSELLRHSAELKQRRSEWMPWNYRDTLARLATPAAA